MDCGMKLENKVALVTGAGRGIGRAIALAYAREGARLALAARTVPELEETARQVQALSAETLIIPTDVTDDDQVQDMVRQAVDRYSTIDILMNNAGIGGPVGPLHENDPAEWARTLVVNVMGVSLCCRAVLPVMLAQDRGKIVNMSGWGGRHSSAYGVSKVGVVYLTQVLAAELGGKNIQVNAMSPGSIHTRMWEETTEAARAIGDADLYKYGRNVLTGGGASMERAADLAVFLGCDLSGKLSGRLINAVSDDLWGITSRIPEIMSSDAYTIGRIEPQ